MVGVASRLCQKQASLRLSVMSEFTINSQLCSLYWLKCPMLSWFPLIAAEANPASLILILITHTSSQVTNCTAHSKSICPLSVSQSVCLSIPSFSCLSSFLPYLLSPLTFLFPPFLPQTSPKHPLSVVSTCITKIEYRNELDMALPSENLQLNRNA